MTCGGTECCLSVVRSEGLRVAVFYIKLQGRLLRPLLEADKPSAPIELRRALGTIDHLLGDYITGARLGTGAWNLSQDPQRPGDQEELDGRGNWRALDRGVRCVTSWTIPSSRLPEPGTGPMLRSQGAGYGDALLVRDVARGEPNKVEEVGR